MPTSENALDLQKTFMLWMHEMFKMAAVGLGKHSTKIIKTKYVHWIITKCKLNPTRKIMSLNQLLDKGHEPRNKNLCTKFPGIESQVKRTGLSQLVKYYTRFK